MAVQVNDLEMELRAQELRIGNYFEYCGNYYKSTGVLPLATFYQPKEDIGERLVYLTDIKPITLTEEILLNLEWVWNEECNSYEKYPNGDARLNISKPSTVSGKRTVFNYVLKSKIADIYYLHQLQNIFYCLCGKELEVNL